MNKYNLEIDIIRRNLRPKASFIEFKYVVIAFLISINYHFIILLFNIDSLHMQMDLFEFWLWVISDTVLWLFGIIPIFSVWRKKLAWYDPFFLFWIMIFGTFFTVFFAICIDPFSSAIWMSFGGRNGFDWLSGNYYLSLFQAEIIIIIFLSILLLTNHRIINYPNTPITKREGRAAKITGVSFGMLGVYGFFRYWGERSLITTVLSSNGAGSFRPELGTARFIIFQVLASMAITLGIIGWLKTRNTQKKTRKTYINLLVLLVIFINLIPHFVTNSRLNILISIMAPIIALRFFNIHLRKRMLVFTIMILLVSWFAITVIRGNEYTKWVSSSGTRIIISDAIDYYMNRNGLKTKQLLYADRVGNIAYIVNNLNNNHQYIYGKSLIAGFGNLMTDFSYRLIGKRLLEKPFFTATQYISIWRFGDPNNLWEVPPSAEGEFFMQLGYISLIFLSYILGVFFFWIRRTISLTTSLGLKWYLIVCLIYIAFYFTMGEVSSFVTYGMYLTLVLIINTIIFLLIGRKIKRSETNLKSKLIFRFLNRN